MTTAYQHRPMSEILAPAADPAEKTDNAEQAPVAEEQAQSELPEKYRGKTVEQVAEMHINAEKELGRIRNEVGTYRGLVSDLSALQRTPLESQPAEQEPVDVSGDDLIADPVGTIRKVVKQDLDKQQADNDANVLATQVQTESNALLTEFGDIDAIVNTEDFQTFAARTPSRQIDFNTAAKGEGLNQVRAARRLLEDYKDFQDATSTETKTELTATEQARKVATEGSGPAGSVSSKPQIFETDVIALINSDPAKYRSPSYQKELMDAIKEKRFVKNT